jgi:5,10-methylene-tetrahydrofolate dehydrogenase/methenyl tetrahydrofolate cyclohydrolase
MNAGLDAADIKETIKDKVEEMSKSNEVKMGLAKVTVKSAEYNGAQIYYIEQKYDIKAINEFVKEDDTKIYNLKTLQNTYEYIVKVGKDVYTETISVPVANSTVENEAKVKDIWKNTTIKQVNYSSVVLK